MEPEELRMVRYDLYCLNCVNYEKSETDYPCFECLDFGWNENSQKPVRYEEADKETLAKRKKNTQVDKCACDVPRARGGWK